MAKIYQCLVIMLTCYRVVSEGFHVIFEESTLLLLATLSLIPPGPPRGLNQIPQGPRTTRKRPRRPRK